MLNICQIPRKKENFITNTIKQGAYEVYRNEIKAAFIKNSPRYVFEFAIVFFVIAFLISSILIGQQANFLLPTIGVFGVAAIRILPGVSMIVNSLIMINYSHYAADTVFNDFNKYKSQKNTWNFKNANPNKNFDSINLKDLTFKYPNSEKYVFKNINFSLKVNECIGIIGESGSGKTTIIDILLGLIKPVSGQIYINGKPTGDSFIEWASLVAYLPQDSLIVEDTIKSNISLESNDTEINFHRLKKSIEQANLKKTIDNLPKGINTIVGGEGGIRLSGGQNKRVALARTFYYGKEILIMDEATSSLDSDAEKFIVDQIKDLKGKKTIVIVTHKQSTLKYCDKIYEIKDEKIIEMSPNLNNNKVHN